MALGGGRVVLVVASVVCVVVDVEVVPALAVGKEPGTLDVGAALVGSVVVEQPAISSAIATRWVRPPARMTPEYAMSADTLRDLGIALRGISGTSGELLEGVEA